MKKETYVRIALLAWAVSATALLVSGRPWTNTTPRAGTASMQTSDSEVQFVRQFVKQYLSYNSSTFRQSQTAAAFLMQENLREQRLTEIHRLNSKISSQNISQSGEVIRLSKNSDSIQGLAQLTIQDLSTSNSPEILEVDFRIQLQSIQSSFENPTGFLISNLIFSSFKKSAAVDSTPFQILVNTGGKAILDFPCAVENLEIKKDLPIQTKITTLNISEIQIHLQQPIENAPITAHCRDKSFKIQLQNSQTTQTLFASVPIGIGVSKIKPTRPKPTAPSPYQKTLENELGFVIEE